MPMSSWRLGVVSCGLLLSMDRDGRDSLRSEEGGSGEAVAVLSQGNGHHLGSVWGGLRFDVQCSISLLDVGDDVDCLCDSKTDGTTRVLSESTR